MSRIVDEMLEQSPDLILLGGDLAEGIRAQERFCKRHLPRLRTPMGVFCVPGNNDCEAVQGDYRLWERMVGDAGAVLLLNRGYICVYRADVWLYRAWMRANMDDRIAGWSGKRWNPQTYTWCLPITMGIGPGHGPCLPGGYGAVRPYPRRSDRLGWRLRPGYGLLPCRGQALFLPERGPHDPRHAGVGIQWHWVQPAAGAGGCSPSNPCDYPESCVGWNVCVPRQRGTSRNISP